MPERRTQPRKDFTYYMQLIDDDTKELIGYLTDISSGGLKVDSPIELPVNKDYRLRMDNIGAVADKPSMVFVARTRWCKVDYLDPFTYNVGFQIINIDPSDSLILHRVIATYGSEKTGKKSSDFFRSNRW
jgi:hypothetical protein